MSDDTTVYIYTLSDPDTGEVRYVGASKRLKQRYYQHLYSDKRDKTQNPKRKWINALLASDKKPVMTVIEDATRENWEEREKYWIEWHSVRGERLTNQSKGGRGATGYAMTAEVRERYLRGIHTGEGRRNRQESHRTPEHRALMRALKHKLTDAQVVQIVELLADPSVSFRSIAARFGTVEWIVSGIANGRTYLHIPRPFSIPPRAEPYGKNYKLSMDQAREIRLRISNGEYRTNLAREYGVDRKLIGLIADNRAYADEAEQR